MKEEIYHLANPAPLRGHRTPGNICEGELTMFRYCFNVVDNKSGNPMRWLGLGLTLSYSFLG